MGVAAFAATPVVVTALFRAVEAMPTAIPFVVGFAAAAAVWILRPRHRPAAAGVAVALAVYAVVLAWLLSDSAPLRSAL